MIAGQAVRYLKIKYEGVQEFNFVLEVCGFPHGRFIMPWENNLDRHVCGNMLIDKIA